MVEEAARFLVKAAADQQLAVRAEHQRIDKGESAIQVSQFYFAGGIPQLDTVIKLLALFTTGAGQGAAIRAERQRYDHTVGNA